MTTPRILTIVVAVLAAATAYADWQHVAPGVDYQEFAEGSMDVHVTRIDLTNDDLKVISTRESERGIKVSDFAKREKAIVAVNGDYFDSTFHPIGLTIGPCGQWIGTRDTTREGFLAVGDATARISTQREVVDPPEQWMQAVVSGWPTLVRDCHALTSEELPGSNAFTRSPAPRTAVGLSQDGRTLYLVVADGRRAGVPGLTLAQLGSFMADRLNVCSAINLDGGGSTAMWVGNRIVNRPSDGVERPVGDHIAVVYRSDFVGCTPQDLAMISAAKASAADSTTTTTTTVKKTNTTVTTTVPPNTAPPHP